MDKILRIAVIGTGGMGTNHVKWWAQNPRAEVGTTGQTPVPDGVAG